MRGVELGDLVRNGLDNLEAIQSIRVARVGLNAELMSAGANKHSLAYLQSAVIVRFEAVGEHLQRRLLELLHVGPTDSVERDDALRKTEAALLGPLGLLEDEANKFGRVERLENDNIAD